MQTYTGVKQSGMPDASGSGNPLNSSGLVSLLQGTTTANYNAWAIMAGVPSTSGTATAGANTTIRQQQSGELYYADSNGPVSGATGLSWSKTAADWAANYFSIAPLTSNPGATATTSLSYDNNGNVTNVGTTTAYTYDYQNRLTQSAIWNGTGTTTTTYAYGPFGERVSQTSSSTTFLYPNKFYSIASSTGTGAKYATTTDYIYSGSNLFATIDQKFVSGTASGTPVTRYNHTDNLGSTNVTSDSSMNVAQWFDYAPYGSVIATTNTGATKAGRQYIGQYTDDSGLSYLNARYFNSGQGQFTTEDPVFWGNPKTQNLTDPHSLNTYSYSEGNPIVKSDPTGRTSALIPGVGLVYNYNGTNNTVCCSPGSPYQYLQNPIAAQPSSQKDSNAPSPYNRFGTTWMNGYFANVQFGTISLGGGNTPQGAAAGIGTVAALAGIGVLGTAAADSAAIDCAVNCAVARQLAQTAARGGARTYTIVGRAGSLIESVAEDTTLEDAARIKEPADVLDGNPWANANIWKPAAAVTAGAASVGIATWLLKPYFGYTDVQEGP
jgi:RHS repeat-associated protein